MPDKEYSSEFVKYEFDETEKKEMSVEMARKMSELQLKQDTKKAVMSDFTGQINGLDADLKDIASKLNTGYEYRNVKCEVRKDFETNKVHYMRTDTGEIVRTRKMRAEDSQTTIC